MDGFYGRVAVALLDAQSVKTTEQLLKVRRPVISINTIPPVCLSYQIIKESSRKDSKGSDLTVEIGFVNETMDWNQFFKDMGTNSGDRMHIIFANNRYPEKNHSTSGTMILISLMGLPNTNAFIYIAEMGMSLSMREKAS